jgi:hypothetical protein
MTVARKLAILPLVSLVGILLISVVLMRDIQGAAAAPSTANRPFRGKKESTPRAKQPPPRHAASGDDEVWQEF